MTWCGIAAALVVSVSAWTASVARAWDAPMCAVPDTADDLPSLRISLAASDRVEVVHGAPPAEQALLACLPTPPAYTGLSSPPHAALPASGARMDAARRAFASLDAHRRDGRTSDALISLASLRTLLPELADRWDLAEGELRPSHERGCAAFERASSSLNSAIAARARVGHARCLLGAGAPGADRVLRAVLARYPELPEALELRLLDARSREARGQLHGAIAIYRDIDLEHAELPEAAEARAALARIAAAGHRVPAMTPEQIAARADRIVRLGPPDLAREEIDRLLTIRLPAQQRTEVTLLAARLARVEGRFADAEALVRDARGARPEPASDASAPSATAEELEAEASARADAEARAELLRLAGSVRTLRRTPTARLFAYLRTAARTGLRPELDGALDEIASRSLPCGLRLEAGVVASGTGDDERVARVLEGCVDAPGSIGVASRYHRARALERHGERDEARAQLALVIEQDRTETRWYGLWARQHLGLDRPNVVSAVAPEADAAVARDEEGKGDAPSAVALQVPLDPSRVAPVTPLLPISTLPPVVRDAVQSDRDADAEALDADAEAELDAEIEGVPERPRWTPMTRDEIELRLAEMSATYADAFPWLARALALVRLGDDLAATEELHEACLAWHEARGNSPVRAGVEAVYRGATPPRRRTESVAVWRARRSLANDDRIALAGISASLGDHGLAVRFGGRGHAAMRPRAYEDIVDDVARARGIDPNLLLAVMRVESVYNPRIVSYAGAVGLMQIMPRTGRLIARSMGREDQFGVDDLLDPRTNIEMAAWYLSSLIRRFDGRVPLAVASYNGGPHNVRRWMSEHSDAMTLEAFLERIPFTQTHRYVRRVLSHWAAYRAQQGLPMVELDPTLPELEPDRVAF